MFLSENHFLKTDYKYRRFYRVNKFRPWVKFFKFLKIINSMVNQYFIFKILLLRSLTWDIYLNY